MTTSESAKEGKTHRGLLGWKDQSKTADKFDNSTWGHKSKDICKRKKTENIQRQGQAMPKKKQQKKKKRDLPK